VSLKEFVRGKEQDLMLLNTKLLHNKQYFKEIKADIKGLKNVNDSTIKDISYHIDLALESDKEWENLQSHFNAIYSGFYDTILKKHPSLTEIELRHCMFIKLHLQTKEIARILLIDPRSVQTARYRIKKKMNLSEEVDLRTHLLDITS
jgi:DNA-binding CsgD family transcriptional regulator